MAHPPDAPPGGAATEAAETDPVRAVGLLFAKQLQIDPLAVGQRRGEAFYTADHLTGKTSMSESFARPMDIEPLADEPLAASAGTASTRP